MNTIFLRIRNLNNIEYYLLSIILVLGFLVRLYKIDNPVADWHSWRQADTASVSRVFVKEGINLLYPRYHDISSIQTGSFNPKGYRFVEFPIFNAIHASLARTFPQFSLEVWGRLISIFSALISTATIFALGKRFIGKWGGVLAAFFFAFLPFNVYFTRVILPEPITTTFALLSLYLFVKFIDEEKTWSLYLSAALFSLAMLVKPFVFFYVVPMAYLGIKKYGLKKLLTNIKIILALDIALIPFFAWRVWINNFPIGIPYWKWGFNGDRIRFRPAFWRWIFGERLGKLILGIWGLIPFSFGLLKTKKNSYFNQFFLLGMFLYVVTFATVNVRHDYYQTIIIPAVSLTLAQGVITMWNTKELNRTISRLLAVFSVILMLGIGTYQIKEFYKINHPEIIEAGRALDKIAPQDALVIAPYNGDTAFLYQTRRFGWPVLDRPLETLIERGADYLVSVNFDDDTNAAMAKYTTVMKTDRFVIIDLRKPKTTTENGS